MRFSTQTPDNKEVFSKLGEKGFTITDSECFKGKYDKHIFTIGQKVILTRLENYPEFNGEVVRITSFREDGEYGKAYYFKADNSLVHQQLNWVYEYRLREMKGEK